MKFDPVFIPLAKGEKSEIDERLLGTGQGTLRLENAMIYEKEQIIKTPGSTALGTNMLDGTAMPIPYRLVTRDGSLVSLSSYGAASPVQSYSPTRNAWVAAEGGARGPTWFRRHAVAGGTGLQSPDLAYLTGYYATAHLTEQGFPVFSLIDETSRLVIYTNTNTATVACNVKVVGCGTKFYLFYATPDVTLRVRVFNPADLSSTPISTIDTQSATSPTCQLDAMKIGADLIKIVYSDSTTSIRYVQYQPSDGSSAAGNLTDGSSNPIASNVLCLVRDLGASGKVGLITATERASIGGAGVGLRLHWDISGGTTAATHELVSDANLPSQPFLQVCGHTRSSNASGDVMAFLEVAGNGATGHADVRLAGALPGTFTFSGAANGPNSGIGATLTASANGTTNVDGQTLSLNNRVLVNAASTGVTETEFGIYKVTTEGNGGAATVLTRATDCDDSVDARLDILVKVTAGTANAGRQFLHHAGPVDRWVFLANGSGGPDRPPFDWVAAPADATVNEQAQRWKRFVVVGARNPSVGSTRATWMLGLGLSSVPFKLRGKTFLLANYDNTPTRSAFDVSIDPKGAQPLQSSYFLIEAPADTSIDSIALVNLPPALQAHIAVGNGGGIQVLSSVPSVAVNAAGEVVAPLRVRNSGQAKSPDRAIEICRLDTSVALGNHAEAAGALYVPGGALTAFDGVRHATLGFAIFPEPPVNTDQFDGSSNGDADGDIISDGETAGTLRYAHVYRWTDANGRIHRSAPGFVDVPLIDLDGASHFATRVQLALTSYRIGDKVITSELYRSALNVLDVLYLLNDTGPLESVDSIDASVSVTSGENDVTAATVSYTDALPDAKLITHELLYTDGGVLANDPIPGALEVCQHNGRTWFVSMDDPRTLFFSSVDNGFDAPFFSGVTAIVEPEAIQGLGSFAESLILFTDSVRHIAPSPGPDAQGRGLFPRSSALAPGLSTDAPLAICRSPVGLLFRPRDPKAGFYMINHGRQVVPAGVDVQRHSDMITRAALFIETAQQVRLFSSLGSLAYDVIHDQWSVFTAQLAATATMWGRVPVYATAAGAIWKETAGTYTEAGAAYGMLVESPWIQLAITRSGVVTNIHGAYRHRLIQGVGKTVGAHTLDVTFYKDYDGGTAIAHYTGAPGPFWDWFVRKSNKLSALKVRIVETSATAGPIINGIMMELGAKSGATKLSSGKQLAPA